MDSATKAAWVAAAVAAVAAVFAIWSAVSSHRSATHSKSSAQSAADTLALERDRRHGELIPDIRVEESTFEDKQEGLWFTNNGPLDYTSVLLRVDPALASPVGALQIGEAWSTEGDIGPMQLGERRLVLIRRNVPMPGTTLRLRLTCENDGGTWTIHKDVEFTPPPMAMWGR
jgi:hypothetical protein